MLDHVQVLYNMAVSAAKGNRFKELKKGIHTVTLLQEPCLCIFIYFKILLLIFILIVQCVIPENIHTPPTDGSSD